MFSQEEEDKVKDNQYLQNKEWFVSDFKIFEALKH